MGELVLEHQQTVASADPRATHVLGKYVSPFDFPFSAVVLPPDGELRPFAYIRHMCHSCKRHTSQVTGQRADRFGTACNVRRRCALALDLPPCCGENIRLVFAWRPAGDAAEVNVRQAANVFGARVRAKNYICVDTDLAAAGLVKVVLGMSDIDDVATSRRDMPYNVRAKHLAIGIVTRPLDVPSDSFPDDQIVSYPYACIDHRWPGTQPSGDSAAGWGSPSKVCMTPGKVSQRDLNITPIRSARSLLACIVPPAIDDFTRIRVGALAQLK
jgi:hypothetical protein